MAFLVVFIDLIAAAVIESVGLITFKWFGLADLIQVGDGICSEPALKLL